jgi:hypothetical protein
MADYLAGPRDRKCIAGMAALGTPFAVTAGGYAAAQFDKSRKVKFWARTSM